MTAQETSALITNYIQAIPDAEDRVLLSDAAQCIVSGSSRATFILLWLACAESLRRRFTVLSQKDNVAGQIMAKITSAEQQHRSIDMLLLNEAKGYGLLSDVQLAELEHIYTKRCIFAHPYNLAPTPLEIAQAAEKVFTYVLSREVKLRNAFIAEQIKLLTTHKNFLDDFEVVVRNYVAVVFPRVADDLQLWALEKLAIEAEPLAGDPNQRLFHHRCVWFATEWIKNIPNAIFPQWDGMAALIKSPRFLTAVFVDANVFSRISAQTQDAAVGNLIDYAKADPNWFTLGMRLGDQNLLSQRQGQKLSEALAGTNLDILAKVGIPLAIYVDRVIQKFKVYDWSAQNTAAEILEGIGPAQIAILVEQKQIELGRNLLQAADGNAWSAKNLLNAIKGDQRNWPTPFVQGIVAEVLCDDSGKVRFKTKRCDDAISLLNRLTLQDAEKILGELTACVNAGVIKDVWRCSDEERQKVLLALDKLDAAVKGTADYLQLTTALQQLQIPDPFGR